MKTFEVIGVDSICVNPKDEARYQNKFVFDDCFNIFDVYHMLQTYFNNKGMSLDFQIRQL